MGLLDSFLGDKPKRSRMRYKPSAQAEKAPASLTLEGRLEVLQKCGLVLTEHFSIEALTEECGPERYDGPAGYDFLLMDLASGMDTQPYHKFCASLMLFYPDEISQDGDYARIVEQMVEISEGALPVTDIADHVDLDARKAWLAYEFNGRPLRKDCEVFGHRMDPTIFTDIVNLFRKHDPSMTFISTFHGIEEPYAIGCVKQNVFNRLVANGVKVNYL